MGAPHPYFRILSEEFAGHGRKFAKVASDVFEIGMIVGLRVGVGTIRQLNGDGTDVPVGICTESITSAHAEYATTAPINVEIVLAGAEIWCPVTTYAAGTTPATAKLGYFADILQYGLGITLDTTDRDDFVVSVLNGASITDVICTPCSAAAIPFAYI